MRLLSHVVDTYASEKLMEDTIRETIASRAKSQGLSAYAVAKWCRENTAAKTISADSVKRYFDGKCALNSRYVSAVCAAIGLQLVETRPKMPTPRNKTSS